MKITKTPFEGLMIIEPRLFEDSRGYFFESYNKAGSGIEVEFLQDNQSWSKKNVIRGLHFQASPYAQTKLVRTVTGRILDVVVDLRQSQPSFKKTFTIELSDENKLQLLIPRGFAHGFSVLSESAEVHYKCDQYYYPEYERGILYCDSELRIDWGVKEAVVSAKDNALPTLAQSSGFFD